MTEQNMEQMLQQILAQRANELIQQSLFPHEIEQLIATDVVSVQDAEELNEEQNQLLADIYNNHVASVDDMDDIRSLHMMLINKEVYVIRDPADVEKMRESLSRANEIFNQKVESGEEKAEDRSELLDAEMHYYGSVSDVEVDLVVEASQALLGLVVLPVHIKNLDESPEVVQ